MRPIYMGLIFFLVGVMGFLSVSIYNDLMTLQNASIALTGALIYVFIAIAVASFPVAIIAEVIKWRKGKTGQNRENS